MTNPTLRAIDLRQRVGGARTPLAARPPSLEGARILLFDNGKVGDEGSGKFARIFTVIGERLSREPGVRVARRRQDLLKSSLEAVAALADEMAAAPFDGVICALLDQGVTLPNLILAAELERRGIAVSLVCQGAGARLSHAAALHMVPGVPVTLLDVARDASPEVVARATEAALDDILGGLVERGAPASGVRDPAATPKLAPTLELIAEDPSRAYTELLEREGLGDGLPLYAPTPARVEAMLATARIAPDAELWPAIAPRARPLLAHDVAALAVAAGCEPPWFSVVAAAYRAMAQPGFRLAQAALTTHPGGSLVLVSGPIAESLGIASGQGALGPGYRANATIGRAVALAASFFLGVRVQGSDLSVQASPAKFTYCYAENLAASPWPGLNADLFDAATSCVTVLKCEGPRTFVNDSSTTAEGILDKAAGNIAGMGGNLAAMVRAQIMVTLNPGHAAIIARCGWSKADVQRYLFDTARNDRSALLGLDGLVAHPDWFAGLERFPVVERPEDFLVVVAGEPGPHSSVALPWGLSRGSTERITWN
jgi:hypothetical protein